MANLLSNVPRRAQPWVATMAQTIYQQPSPEEVHAQHSRMVGMLNERFPQAAVILEEAANGEDPAGGRHTRLGFDLTSPSHNS